MTQLDPAERSQYIRNKLTQTGLFVGEGFGEEGAVRTWRVSPDPFWISQEEFSFLQRLGPQLHAFYRAANRLYDESVRGRRPAWVAGYLDQGKPDSVLSYGRMNRLKGALPRVIRPDLLITEAGIVASELDAVPGGIGQTEALNRIYEETGFQVVGGPHGMAHGFGRMLCSLTDVRQPVMAVVVSEESRDYRPEMDYLCRTLRAEGYDAYLLEPREVRFQEEGLYFEREGKRYPIHLLYRFFELFDLKNIPKSELILYAAKKKAAVLMPPIKAYLEEKLLFGLFHHPVLEEYWLRELGTEIFAHLSKLFPKTWIMDPHELPPYGVIPGLTVDGRPVTDWRELASCTQKERQFVIKPSGFSELAWGSRGLFVGQDLPSEDWKEAIETALAAFRQTPYVLQRFHKGKRVEMAYHDPNTGKTRLMTGRVRLCPYYFLEGPDESPLVHLGGVLATVCPLDKKAIHGMTDAVMAPAAVKHH